MSRRNAILHYLRLVSIEPIVLSSALGSTISAPVLSELFFRRICEQFYHFNASQCSSHQSSEAALRGDWALWMSYSTYALTIPAVLISLVVGAWSDRAMRRRPAMLLPSLGQLVAALIALVLYWSPEAPVALLLLSPLAYGLGGGVTTLLMGVYAHLADSVGAGDALTVRIALVEGCEGVGITAAYFLGAWLVARVSPAAAFVVSAATGLFNVAYIIARVKESDRAPANTSAENVARGDLARSVLRMEESVWRSLKESWQTLVRRRSDGLRTAMWLALGALFLFMLVDSGEAPLLQPYLEFPPIAWSLSEYIINSGYFNVINTVGVLVIVPLLKSLGWRDASIGIIGACSKAANSYLLSVARCSAVVFLSFSVGVLKYPLIISVRALTSKLARADEQGRVFALISSTESVAPLVGTFAYAALFRATVGGPWPGLVFAVSALLCCPQLAAFAAVDLTMRRAERRDDERDEWMRKRYARHSSVEESDHCDFTTLP